MKDKKDKKICKNCQEMKRGNFKSLGYCYNPESPYYEKVIFEHTTCDFYIFKKISEDQNG